MAATTWRWVFVALAVGAVVKGAFLLVHMEAPDFSSPHLDALFHDYLARGWGLGSWTLPPSVPDPLVDKTPLARPPAYPAFLAALYRLSQGSVIFARVVQLALGLVAALLAARLAHRLAPQSPIAPPTAAALTVLSPTLLYFEGELVAAPVAAVVGVGLLLGALRLREHPSAWGAAGVGLGIGVLGLLRPNLLLFAPVVAAFVSADAWLPYVRPAKHARTTPEQMKGALGMVAVMTAAALLVTLPVTLRNQTKSGEAIFISTNGGLTLLHGNHAKADGVTMSLPAHPALKHVQEVSPFAYRKLVPLVAKATGAKPSFGAAEKWFRGLATTWMAENPGAFLALTFKKALLLVGPREVSNNKQVELERSQNVVLQWLPVRWPLLFLFACVGAVAVARRSRREEHEGDAASIPVAKFTAETPTETTTEPGTKRAKKRDKGARANAGKKGKSKAKPPRDDEGPAKSDSTPAVAPDARARQALTLSVLYCAVALASVVVFLAASRFRAPIVPVLAALGGAGVAALVRAAIEKRVDGAIAIAIAVALAIGAINWTGYAPDVVQWHRDRAQAHLNAGRLAAAKAELEQAQAANPKSAEVLLALGVVEAQQNRLSTALAHFQRAVDLAPGNLQAQAQLGAAKLGLGDNRGALQAFDVVIRKGGGDATLHYNRGMALGRLERHAEAKAAFEKALAVRPDFGPAKLMLERLR